MNYFELFGIPVGFEINQADLKKKFYELSRKYHPDFHVQAEASEQAELLNLSSLVNRGFKVFSDSDSTLQYVLELKGLVEPEEKFQLNPAFLGEVMEINEELMDLEMEPNAAGLASIDAKTQALLKNIYHDVEGILAGYKEGISPEKALLPVKEYYYQKKYLQRILDKIASLRNIATRT